MSWGGSWSTTELQPSEAEPPESPLMVFAALVSRMRVGFSHSEAEHGDEPKSLLDGFHQLPPQTPPWNSSSMILHFALGSLYLFFSGLQGNRQFFWWDMKVKFSWMLYIYVLSYIFYWSKAKNIYIYKNIKIKIKIKRRERESRVLLIYRLKSVVDIQFVGDVD